MTDDEQLHRADDRAHDEAARDHEIVAGFVAGHPPAVRAFATRLGAVARMAACLNRRSGGPLGQDEVADLAQDVTMIALRKAETFPQGAPLDAWLYRITNLELCNALRRRRRATTAEFDEAQHEAVDDSIEQLERRERIARALEQLPPHEATAVRLHHLDGLTFVEVAARLGVTENTVKGRYYRALRQLTRTMKQDNAEGRR